MVKCFTGTNNYEAKSPTPISTDDTDGLIRKSQARDVKIRTGAPDPTNKPAITSDEEIEQ